MFDLNSDMTDTFVFSDKEKEIFEYVLEYWPTTSLEIAVYFGENISTRENKKRLSTKYSYYIKKLVEKKLVLCKKAGNSIIVWPVVVEKYRVIHDILKNDEHFQIVNHINSARGKNA